jgi:hypothetical protein
VVALALPPPDTNTTPPLLIVGSLAAPPDWTRSLPPLLIVTSVVLPLLAASSVIPLLIVDPLKSKPESAPDTPILPVSLGMTLPPAVTASVSALMTRLLPFSASGKEAPARNVFVLETGLPPPGPRRSKAVCPMLRAVRA